MRNQGGTAVSRPVLLERVNLDAQLLVSGRIALLQVGKHGVKRFKSSLPDDPFFIALERHFLRHAYKGRMVISRPFRGGRHAQHRKAFLPSGSVSLSSIRR